MCIWLTCQSGYELACPLSCKITFHMLLMAIIINYCYDYKDDSCYLVSTMLIQSFLVTSKVFQLMFLLLQRYYLIPQHSIWEVGKGQEKMRCFHMIWAVWNKRTIVMKYKQNLCAQLSRSICLLVITEADIISTVSDIFSFCFQKCEVDALDSRTIIACLISVHHVATSRGWGREGRKS